jgi:hypothetical protein
MLGPVHLRLTQNTTTKVVYGRRKEEMKKVQSEANNLQKCLDAVEDIA